jgi:hypothetical protein
MMVALEFRKPANADRVDISFQIVPPRDYKGGVVQGHYRLPDFQSISPHVTHARFCADFLRFHRV